MALGNAVEKLRTLEAMYGLTDIVSSFLVENNVILPQAGGTSSAAVTNMTPESNKVPITTAAIEAPEKLPENPEEGDTAIQVNTSIS